MASYTLQIGSGSDKAGNFEEVKNAEKKSRHAALSDMAHKQMETLIAETRPKQDTLGGVIEVGGWPSGCLVHVQWNRKWMDSAQASRASIGENGEIGKTLQLRKSMVLRCTIRFSTGGIRRPSNNAGDLKAA